MRKNTSPFDVVRVETMSGEIEITAAAVTAAIFPHLESGDQAILLTAEQLHNFGEAALALAAKLRERTPEFLKRLEVPCTCGTKLDVDDCERHPSGPVVTLRKGVAVEEDPDPYGALNE